MIDYSAINGNGGPQQVNLKQISQHFMLSLQRHFDILAFNISARESAREETYNARVKAPKVMPIFTHHQNFEQMQAYSRDLLTRQVLRDSMNLAVTCMNNTHLYLILFKKTMSGDKCTDGVQKLHDVFIKAFLHEKFNSLEREYGIISELENSIVSLGIALQALVQHGGIVKEGHVNEYSELVLELKSVDVTNGPMQDGKPVGKLVNLRKVFRQGEAVLFSDLELQLILVTIASFADSLFKSALLYVRSKKDVKGN